MLDSISRRNLLVGAGSIGACLIVGGIARATVGENDLLRPPGGQDEAKLWGACIKCDRCRSACPQHVIAVASVEDGFLNARTPKMNFHLGSCDFCKTRGSMACVDACPTSALMNGFNPEADKIGVAQVISQECLLFRSGSNKCSKQCIDACEYDALALVDGKLVVDESKCNGCGACTFVCPSASYGTYTGTGLRGIEIVASRKA